MILHYVCCNRFRLFFTAAYTWQIAGLARAHRDLPGRKQPVARCDGATRKSLL